MNQRICAAFILFFTPTLLLSADWERAHSYLTRGQLDQAYRAYTFIAHSEMDAATQAQAYLHAAYVRYSQGKMDEARSLLRLTFILDPDIEVDRKFFSAAYRSFASSVRTSTPIDVMANLQMAETKFHEGLLEECMADLKAMVERGYAFKEIYKLMGDVLIQQDRLDEAKEVYQKAVGAEGFRTRELINNPTYRLLKAIEAVENKDYDKALELLPEETKNLDLVKFRLTLLAYLQKYDKLMGYLSDHSAFREDHKELGYIYAVLLVRMGLEEEAVEELIRLSKQDPFWVEPLLALARLHVKRKNPDIAENYYEKTTLLEPTHVEYLTEYGIFLTQRKKYEEARRQCAAAYQFSKGKEEVLISAPWYAYTLFLTGDYNRAESVMNAYLKHGGKKEWGDTLLGMVYLMQDNVESCKELLTEPRDTLQKRILARCFLAAGEPDRAREIFPDTASLSSAGLQDRTVILLANRLFQESLTSFLSSKEIDASVREKAHKILDAVTAMRP